MLKLFVSSVLDLLPLMLTVVLALVNRPHAPMERRRMGLITWFFGLLGLGVAGVIAYLRLNTPWISLPAIKVWAGLLILLMVVVFTASLWILGSRQLHLIDQTWRHRLLTVTSMLFLAIGGFYFALPYFLSIDSIVLMGTSAFETQSILRLVGFAGGTLLALACAWVIARSYRHMSRRVCNILTTLVLLVVIVPKSFSIYNILSNARMLPRLSFVFNMVLFFQQHLVLTLLAMALVAALPGVIALKVPSIKGKKLNPAQVRLHRADVLSRREFFGASIAFGAALVWVCTDGKTRAEAKPELSPIEPSVVEGDKIKVDRKLVSDGHLHRFAYKTDTGTEIRFIVIKKNQVSFGTGLDACEICGNAGYYERNGKVICSRCDVMMNTQTIGFKGGCNPIPISYKQTEDSLVFSVKELSQFEDVFR
ncbi:Fe-S-containing protein [Mobiluncus mulieris]|uniref:DUF2318 domain-containing protein n=1 Tax=Mobiluncus mulieris TaxID=2052 RepID=A0ABD4TU27_9ACTO|nr:Fe-S-containing protein [Mobiluncus mulieris]MCU9968399.1 DUF2318 domain-containing protein [Mobiluncus mulieris]MCU9972631.1 DUF2318 domain-containing protein [Mobiluncus mulieris]MCV0010138.1 DUF2318 domain-containing protein [Mobiluncus mulieris]NMW75003.1 DUF2318 domain-containing protein [Mobiluncus mulieris]NMX00393.1 DUF2318 domain-containing protein [Mobiluncus mulieris]